jgi:hypothetical protein
MKNTLIAVLIMVLCYDHTQAQSARLPVIIADGTISTDKLASDLMASGKPAGVAIHSNQLPTISNTLYNALWQRFLQRYPALQKPPQTSLSANQSARVEPCTYVAYMQLPILRVHPLPKPRPLNRRTGWLQ